MEEEDAAGIRGGMRRSWRPFRPSEAVPDRQFDGADEARILYTGVCLHAATAEAAGHGIQERSDAWMFAISDGGGTAVAHSTRLL